MTPIQSRKNRKFVEIMALEHVSTGEQRNPDFLKLPRDLFHFRDPNGTSCFRTPSNYGKKMGSMSTDLQQDSATCNVRQFPVTQLLVADVEHMIGHFRCSFFSTYWL